MKVQREAGKLPEDLIIKDHAGLEKVSFLVLGDTGGGDASQYAVIKPLLARGRDTRFMVICGDVIYPAGDIEDYEAKFYEPYKDYQRPIFGLPGHHDWYDGLNGFMYHLCGVEASAVVATEDEVLSRKERLRQLLWRKSKVDLSRLPERKRVESDQRSNQRSPYFAVEAGPLLIVGIDTGISGDIDREQGEWLRKISREIDKPKILLTGKPIYVDGEYHPGVIEGGGTVDEIVREPEHSYVAVIGHGTHNYQRYRVKVEGREDPIYYIISGGGGASMHATHKIPKVELNGVNEDDFVCYPRRGDSLSFYSKLYDRRFGFKKGWLDIPPDEAAAYMGERLRITPEREEDRKACISRRTRRLAHWIFPLPSRGRGSLHHYFSELFDWNELPLFKNFLQIDVSGSELRICCFAATGCLEHEKSPPIEDEIKINLTPEAGTEVEPDSLVSVTVSSGPPKKATVPDVSGTSIEEAGQALLGAGLALANSRTKKSHKRVGTVISTDPSAGSRVALGSSVIPVVSSGLPRMSRWVVVAALAVLVLAAVVAGLYFIGSGSQEATVAPAQEELTKELAAPEMVRATVRVVDNPSYLSIRTDGTSVYAQYTQPGFAQTYEASETIGVTAGNAGAVRVEVDGQDMGALGNYGEIATRTFDSRPGRSSSR